MENSISLDAARKLMYCFPGSYINQYGEFVAVPHTWCSSDGWFNISSCSDETDLQCKVLECLSRAAYKTNPYATDCLNDRFHAHISNGINRYLGTRFARDDFRTIYTELGYGVDRDLTRRFIESGYDMALLTERNNG